MFVSDNDVIVLPGSVNYVSLDFSQTTFSLHISAAAFVCGFASVCKAMKQERFRWNPYTNIGWEERGKKVFIKQGGEISAGQPGGNQL